MNLTPFSIIEKLLERIDRLKPDETLKVIGEIAKSLGQLGSGK